MKVKFKKEGIKDRESKEESWKELKKKMWRNYRETEERNNEVVNDEVEAEKEKIEAVDNNEVERKIDLELKKPSLIIKSREEERKRDEVIHENQCQIPNLIHSLTSNSNSGSKANKEAVKVKSDVKEVYEIDKIYEEEDKMGKIEVKVDKIEGDRVKNDSLYNKTTIESFITASQSPSSPASLPEPTPTPATSLSKKEINMVQVNGIKEYRVHTSNSTKSDAISLSSSCSESFRAECSAKIGRNDNSTDSSIHITRAFTDMFAPKVDAEEIDDPTENILQGDSNLISPATGSSGTCSMGFRNRWESHLLEDLSSAQSVSTIKRGNNTTIFRQRSDSKFNIDEFKVKTNDTYAHSNPSLSSEWNRLFNQKIQEATKNEILSQNSEEKRKKKKVIKVVKLKKEKNCTRKGQRVRGK